jgi:REP element-mobilizing transposase RayT
VPFLIDNIRDKVIYHIIENARSKHIFVDHLNGYLQHLHALISLGGKQNISDIMHLIKGESSYWINKNKLTRIRFEWQDDYYAVSAGINQLGSLREYIRKQVWHHGEESLEQELDRLIEDYKLEKMKD